LHDGLCELHDCPTVLVKPHGKRSPSVTLNNSHLELARGVLNPVGGDLDASLNIVVPELQAL
jgi:hypothetical protein